MSHDRWGIRDRRWRMILLFSFVPLTVKAIDYAVLGSFTPLWVLLGFGLVVIGGLYLSPRAARFAVGLWAVVLVLWGVVRFGLMGMLLSVDIGEVHPVHQINAGYVAWSLAHIVAGAYLYRRRKHALGGGGDRSTGEEMSDDMVDRIDPGLDLQEAPNS